jgi:hypothetical protein
VLLVLFAAEGVTILAVRQLLTLHFFIGDLTRPGHARKRRPFLRLRARLCVPADGNLPGRGVRGLFEAYPHLQDALAVGGLDITLVRRRGQRDLARE